LGFPVQLWPAVQEPQLPLPSQTRLVPQLVPPITLLPSAQVCAPVAHEYTPFLQMLGLPVQAPPAVHATQAPAALQTMLVPQLVPADLLPPSTHVIAPVEHDVAPFLQMLGFVVQAAPAVHDTQVPEPLHTWFVPQVVPAAVLPPSMHVIAPVEHVVVPTLQAVGLPVHDWLAVHATHMPPLQTMLVPQLTPGALLLPSTHVMAPVVHAVTPLRHADDGLVVHAWPAVQATQPPEPLQTMLVPQLVPALFGVPLVHVEVPVEHDATPL
jgi:hypothetical protein